MVQEINTKVGEMEILEKGLILDLETTTIIETRTIILRKISLILTLVLLKTIMGKIDVQDQGQDRDPLQGLRQLKIGTKTTSRIKIIGAQKEKP